MIQFPHKEKLLAAIDNRKAAGDIDILREAYHAYEQWIQQMTSLRSTGDEFLSDLVRLLNEYKNYLEVDFIKRQKGQLKLDNSVIEEFLPYLVSPKLLDNLPTNYELETGSQTSFMSLSFCPSSIRTLDKPQVTIKEKDQDFTIGKSVFSFAARTAAFNSYKSV